LSKNGIAVVIRPVYDEFSGKSVSKYANTNTTTIKIQKSPQGEGYGLNHDTTYQRTTTQARSRLYYCTCSWV